jgi:hypothetical protein
MIYLEVGREVVVLEVRMVASDQEEGMEGHHWVGREVGKVVLRLVEVVRNQLGGKGVESLYGVSCILMYTQSCSPGGGAPIPPIGLGFKNPAPNLILGAAIICCLPPDSCCWTIKSMMFCALS